MKHKYFTLPANVGLKPCKQKMRKSSPFFFFSFSITCNYLSHYACFSLDVIQNRGTCISLRRGLPGSYSCSFRHMLLELSERTSMWLGTSCPPVCILITFILVPDCFLEQFLSVFIHALNSPPKAACNLKLTPLFSLSLPALCLPCFFRQYLGASLCNPSCGP